ncbi:hypothetical protein [Phaeodactylibacter luteus]|nr:hypothetical protein [Phaeodactylibacter luteus]
MDLLELLSQHPMLLAIDLGMFETLEEILEYLSIIVGNDLAV